MQEIDPIGKARLELFDDYRDLIIKYREIMPAHEFCYALLQYVVKSTMDIAPTKDLGRKTVEAACVDGILWHLEAEQNRCKEDDEDEDRI
jgi:hypothetical protein